MLIRYLFLWSWPLCLNTCRFFFQFNRFYHVLLIFIINQGWDRQTQFVFNADSPPPPPSVYFLSCYFISFWNYRSHISRCLSFKFSKISSLYILRYFFYFFFLALYVGSIMGKLNCGVEKLCFFLMQQKCLIIIIIITLFKLLSFSL